MYKDYTLKASLPDRKRTEALLKKIGAFFVGLDIQTDTYFKVPNGRLKLRQGTLGSLITHYERSFDNGAERTVVRRYEKNPSQTAIEELLKEHSQIGIVRKERSIYDLNGVRIHLDLLPGGEEFVEIEAMDKNGNIAESDLRGLCLQVKSMLLIEDDDLVPTGYAILSQS